MTKFNRGDVDTTFGVLEEGVLIYTPVQQKNQHSFWCVVKRCVVLHTFQTKSRTPFGVLYKTHKGVWQNPSTCVTKPTKVCYKTHPFYYTGKGVLKKGQAKVCHNNSQIMCSGSTPWCVITLFKVC